MKIRGLQGLSLNLREAFKKKKKKSVKFFQTIIGALFEKKCFFPLEMSNTCKNFQNPNIAGK